MFPLRLTVFGIGVCWLIAPAICSAQPAASPFQFSVTNTATQTQTAAPSQAPQPTETFTAKEIRLTLLRQAKDYAIKSGETELKLGENSLLNWSNTARSTEQGVLMVWLDDGMPLLMGSLFTYEWLGTKVKHEFTSLSSGPLNAKYGSQIAWTSSKAGVKWRKFESIKNSSSLKQISKSKTRRLSQMRAIAREFKVEMKDARENKMAHLRFMSEPVYRFASKKYKTTDAGIFSFCVGTDPEAFLIIRATEGGIWEYAFVPSIDWELTAYHGKKRVWYTQRVRHESNVIGNEAFIRDPYVSFHLTTDRDFTPHPDLKRETIE